MRLVKVVTSTRSSRAWRALHSASRSSIWPWTGRTSTWGSSSPVGRMICSTTSPWDRSSSQGPGVAETYTAWPMRPRNSSKVRGRLSRAEGRRNPKSTRVVLRERSPLDMPPTWGTLMWLSSMNRMKSLGK